METSPLWHGAKEEYVQKITCSKFDRGLAGEHGMYATRALAIYKKMQSHVSGPGENANLVPRRLELHTVPLLLLFNLTL